MLHAYSVGQLYHPSRRSWPTANQFQYRGGEHELLLFLPSPSRHEVEGVKSGESEFALHAEGPLISLCYRFERSGRGIPWSDANYSWHRLKAARPEEATLPPPWEEGSPELRALLHVVLVDASTGLIAALKALTFSPAFTAAIHRAIWDQAHRPWDAAEYDRALAALYARYPSSEALVAACSVRTKGGA